MRTIYTSIVAITLLGFTGIGFGELESNFLMNQKLFASDGGEWERFGYNISISGNIALVSANADDNGPRSGGVYIYEQQPSGWSEIQKLTNEDVDDFEYFGSSIAISGDVALIGALNPGRAYVYKQQGDGTWALDTQLFPTDEVGSSGFGDSVAISGDTVVVGRSSDNFSSGCVYIYERGTPGWPQGQKLSASDGESYDYFGKSIAISGDILVVGAFRDNDNANNSGSVYIYERQGDGSWSGEQKLNASDADEYDFFGSGISIFDETILVGAYLDDDNGSSSGSVYFYQRQEDGSWSGEQKLTASDGGADDRFGISVAIYGETAVVGAFREQESEEGGSSSEGKAYIFKQQGDGSWIEVQKLTNGEVNSNSFGESVAISSGETVIVNDNYDNNDNGDFAGCVYIYASPSVFNACCVHTGCEILTKEQCSNLGGVYMVGASCEDCVPSCNGDINADGIIDVLDLLGMLSAWGTCP